MTKYFENLARAFLGQSYSELDTPEQSVIESIAEHEPIAENTNATFHEQLSFGQRLADKMSAFGGSWAFIIIFLLILLSWMTINSLYLVSPKHPFDPYPYILLNLVLSTLAALQAPVIMMSQNRQAAKDRMEIEASYKLSLKMELEIMQLNEKIEKLLNKQNSTC